MQSLKPHAAHGPAAEGTTRSARTGGEARPRRDIAVASAPEQATLDVVEVSQGVASLFLLAPAVVGSGLDLPRDCILIMDLRAPVRGDGPAEGAFLLYDGTDAVLSGRAISAVLREGAVDARFGDLGGVLAGAFGRQAGITVASEALSEASLSPGAPALTCRSDPATARLCPREGDAEPASPSGRSALAALAGLLGIRPANAGADGDDPGVGELALMIFPRFFLAS